MRFAVTIRLIALLVVSSLISVSQVFLPNTFATETPPPVFTELASGSNHVCAITDKKQIYCWGQNAWSQLGTSEFKDNLVPKLVYQVDDATAISAGETHTCAIVARGNIKCWGNNTSGQVGDGIRKLGIRELPVFVHAISGAKDIALGAEHSCALLSDGKIMCWGSNTFGQLGDGTNSDSILPVAVKSQRTFINVAAGSNHTCAIDSLGDAYCWGNNANGELGIGNRISKYEPTLVLGLSKLKNVSARFNSTCAIDSLANANCWGEGANGQLGNQDIVDKLLPDKVVDIAQGTNSNGTYNAAKSIVEVQAGSTLSCVLSTLSTLHCWGNSNVSKVPRSPYYVGISSTEGNALSVDKFSVGHSHVCVLRKDGSIYCSGLNDEGQFGIGSKQTTYTSSFVPLNYWPAPPSKITTEIIGNTLRINWLRDVTDFDPVPTARVLTTTILVAVDGSDLICEAVATPTCSLGPIKGNSSYKLKLTADNTKKKSEVNLLLETKEVLSDQESRDKAAREEAEAKLKKEEEAKKQAAAEEELKKKEALEKAAAEERSRLEEIRKAAELEKEKELQKIKDVCFAYAMKIEEIRFAMQNSISKFAYTAFELSFKKLLSTLPEARNCMQMNYEIADFDKPIKNLEILALAQVKLNSDAESLLRRGKLLYTFTCAKGNLKKQLTANKIACPTGYKFKN